MDVGLSRMVTIVDKSELRVGEEHQLGRRILRQIFLPSVIIFSFLFGLFSAVSLHLFVERKFHFFLTGHRVGRILVNHTMGREECRVRGETARKKSRVDIGEEHQHRQKMGRGNL